MWCTSKLWLPFLHTWKRRRSDRVIISLKFGKSGKDLRITLAALASYFKKRTGKAKVSYRQTRYKLSEVFVNQSHIIGKNNFHLLYMRSFINSLIQGDKIVECTTAVRISDGKPCKCMVFFKIKNINFYNKKIVIEKRNLFLIKWYNFQYSL